MDQSLGQFANSRSAGRSAGGSASDSGNDSGQWHKDLVKQWGPRLGRLRNKDWTWLQIALCLMAVPASTGAVAYHWLAAVPDDPECKVPQWSQADFERLQCLHQAMQSGETRKILAGIDQLQQWPEHSPVYSVAQRLLEDWSVVILSQAQEEFEAGEWDASSKLIAKIPEQFAVKQQAQQRSDLWQEVRKQGEQLYQRAEEAIQAQNWKQATEHAKALAGLDNDYWRQQGLRELPLRIEAQQASAEPGSTEPVAQSLPQPLPSRPRQQRVVAPVTIGLSRPTASQPSMVQPEFSAA